MFRLYRADCASFREPYVRAGCVESAMLGKVAVPQDFHRILQLGDFAVHRTLPYMSRFMHAVPYGGFRK